MKKFDEKIIEELLGRFMDGTTTIEEEDLLAEYFRRGDVRTEWEDYREMFEILDNLENFEDFENIDNTEKSTKIIPLFRWAAAACVALIIGFAWYSHTDFTDYTDNSLAKTQEEAHTDFTDYTDNSLAKTRGKAHTDFTDYTEKENPVRDDLNVAQGLIPGSKKETIKTSPSGEASVNKEVSSPQIPDLDEDALRLQQARTDNCVAEAMAQTIIAEYYAMQIANGEEPSLPTVHAVSGDGFSDDFRERNIMTLIMQ